MLTLLSISRTVELCPHGVRLRESSLYAGLSGGVIIFAFKNHNIVVWEITRGQRSSVWCGASVMILSNLFFQDLSVLVRLWLILFARLYLSSQENCSVSIRSDIFHEGVVSLHSITRSAMDNSVASCVVSNQGYFLFSNITIDRCSFT